MKAEREAVSLRCRGAIVLSTATCPTRFCQPDYSGGSFVDRNPTSELKPLCLGTMTLSTETRPLRCFSARYITQRPQGLMAAETTANNKRNALPLHPCLVGLPPFPRDERPVAGGPEHERNTKFN